MIIKSRGRIGKYRSVYPPAADATYVKATSELGGYNCYFVCDITKSLVGSWLGTSWLSNTGQKTNQRFHVDLGVPVAVRRVYYENNHTSGTNTNVGGKNFTLWGSNVANAFTTLTYATDTDWNQLTTNISAFVQHAASDSPDPRYILVSNYVPYRYYAFKIADNWGSTNYISLRRVVMQVGV